MLKTTILVTAAASILGLGSYVTGALDCVLPCSPCSLLQGCDQKDDNAVSSGLLAGGAESAIAASAIATVAEAQPASGAATATAPAYTVDTVHSAIVFRVRHAGVAYFWGRFNDFSGEFSINKENPAASTLQIEVRTTSIDTANANRDEHLRSPDFFDAKQFPVATFKSTKFEKAGEDKFKVTGDFTLHGVTKPVTADLTWIGTGSFRGQAKAGFEAEFAIKRSDFGMTTYIAPDGGESGGLGNTVRIVVAIEGNGK